MSPDTLIHALDLIHQSIEGGSPVIVWDLSRAEFGIIYGYNDEKSQFTYRNATEHSLEVPYQKLGRTLDNPELFVGLISTSSNKLSPESTLIHALETIISHERGKEPIISGYTSGIAAYGVWIHAFENDQIDPVGHAYQVRLITEARAHAVSILEKWAKHPVVQNSPITANLWKEALEQYKLVYRILLQLYPSFPYGMPGVQIDIRERSICFMQESKSQITKSQGSGIQSVGSSILHVDNLEKMVTWFGDILDIPTAMNPDIPFYVFDMDNGVNLMLDDHRNMKDQVEHPICMLRTMDIEQSYAWVKKCGIPIVLHMQKHPSLNYFNIRDSENNIVMIASSTWVNPQPIPQNHADHPIKNHLNCIVIPVTDLKRATEFYAHLLGHAIKPERQDGGPIYWFDMDNGTGILLDDNRQHDHFEKYPTFMLKAPNIRDAYRYMQSKNTRILVEIEHDHHFFIQDPEGNSVIICM